MSKKANAASISNPRRVYWPRATPTAKRKQLYLVSATCRAAPRAGCGSHRPFGRHQRCLPSAHPSLMHFTHLALPAVTSTPDNAVSWTPTLPIARSSVRRLKIFKYLYYPRGVTKHRSTIDVFVPFVVAAFRLFFVKSPASLCKLLLV